MMNDGYDLFCMMTIGERTQADSELLASDDVTCACADYLDAEGYDVPLGLLSAKRVMSIAAQLIPTTNNIT